MRTTADVRNVVHQRNKSSDKVLISETRNYKRWKVEEEAQEREIKITLKQTACAANGRIMISKHNEDEEKCESHPSERNGSERA